MHRCQVKVNILPWTSFICISLKQGRSVNLDIIEFNDKDQLQHLWQDRDLSDEGEKASLLPKGAYKFWLGETVHLFQWTGACKFLNNIGSIWNIDPQFNTELSYSELWGIVQQDWLEYKKKELEGNQSVFMGEMHNLAAKLKAILNSGWFFPCPVHKYQLNCLMSTVVVQIFNLQSSPEAQTLVFGRKLGKTWRITSPDGNYYISLKPMPTDV